MEVMSEDFMAPNEILRAVFWIMSSLAREDGDAVYQFRPDGCDMIFDNGVMVCSSPNPCNPFQDVNPSIAGCTKVFYVFWFMTGGCCTVVVPGRCE